MRWGATFYVMRYDRPLAQETRPRRVTVAHHAYALDRALEWATNQHRRSPDVAFWIERKGTSAHSRTRPRD